MVLATYPTTRLPLGRMTITNGHVAHIGTPYLGPAGRFPTHGSHRQASHDV
jgi:hypothetical protein